MGKIFIKYGETLKLRKLYHNILSPVCRKIRVAMAEKGLSFDLIHEELASKRSEFLEINPAGDVPVLVEDNGFAIPDHFVLCEYLEEKYPEPPLLGRNISEKVEVRRLSRWFDEKFSREVSSPLLIEKVIKTLKCGGAPNSVIIRTAKARLRNHLEYVEWLVLRRNWLAGEAFSYADISAATQLSVIDYLGDVPWDKYPDAHDWYARIKSRPCFRSILHDKILGINPPIYYADLDF